jgi:DNA-binding NarL/FixJ family response regulator
MSIRILVADDETIVRQAFVNLLSIQDGLEVVTDAADGAEAVQLAATHRPDVALLDIRMPAWMASRPAQYILATSQTTKALMLTTFDLDEYIYRALSVGASGFLLKDTTAEELINAVRVVARGDALLAPAITKRLIAEFAKQHRPSAEPSATDQLTPRETAVLTLIARGLSNAELAEQLVVSEHTVRTHISHLFAKLGVRDRAQAVIMAYESGLVIPGGR